MPAKKNTSKKKSNITQEIKKGKSVITIEKKVTPSVIPIHSENTPSMVTVAVEEERQAPVVEESIAPGQVDVAVVSTTETSRGVLWIVLIVAFLIGAFVGGGVIYTFNRFQKTPIQVVTASPVAIVSAEPSPAMERSSLKLQVLNGTGIKGEASRIKMVLEKVGYTNVQTGNAASQDFTLTEISIKDIKKEYIPLLTSDLSEEASVSSEIKSLDEKNDFDVIITLGKD